MIIRVKLASGETVEMLDFVAVAKGLIEPTALNASGDLRPQEAAKIINLVTEHPFLKKCQAVPMKRLTRYLQALDIANRELRRVPQGTDPSDDQKTGVQNVVGKLTALDVQLFADITLDFLREHAENPKLTQLIEEALAKRLQGDLLDLAFCGVNDSGAKGANKDETFLNLNKGWLQIAKESAAAGGPNAVKSRTIDPATDGWRVSLAAMRDAADPRFKKDSVFVMSELDADAYADEIGFHVTGRPLAPDSPARRFGGKPIEVVPDMPEGHALFTPLKNLGFGLHSMIRRDRNWNARKRVVEYTYDTACDFEFALHQAAVLGQPPAAA